MWPPPSQHAVGGKRGRFRSGSADAAASVGVCAGLEAEEAKRGRRPPQTSPGAGQRRLLRRVCCGNVVTRYGAACGILNPSASYLESRAGPCKRCGVPTDGRNLAGDGVTPLRLIEENWLGWTAGPAWGDRAPASRGCHRGISRSPPPRLTVGRTLCGTALLIVCKPSPSPSKPIAQSWKGALLTRAMAVAGARSFVRLVI